MRRKKSRGAAVKDILLVRLHKKFKRGAVGCKNAVQNIWWFYHLNPIRMDANPDSSEGPPTHLSIIHYMGFNY